MYYVNKSNFFLIGYILKQNQHKYVFNYPDWVMHPTPMTGSTVHPFHLMYFLFTTMTSISPWV